MKKALTINDIHIQSDFEDELVEEPDNIKFYYDDLEERYQVLLEVGKRSLKGYRIFDYLLYNLSFTNSISNFELDLINEDLYNKYVDSVLSRDDEFLKAYMIVYLKGEDIDERYGTRKNLASVFINDKDHNFNYRVNGLMGLSQYKLDKDTVDYIKESLLSMVNSLPELELITEEVKENLIDTYYHTIDLNQKDYNTNTL